MSARSASLIFLCTVVVTLSATAATADPPTIAYRLDGDNAYQKGCFGMCMCPVLLAEMQGTFGLTAGPPSGSFLTWTISEIDWKVPMLGLRLTGSGVFLRSTGPDAQQQMILHLSTNGEPVETYDSGIVPAVSELPRIDALVSLHGMLCHDTVLVVRAAPGDGGGPVTFRFEGTVDTVFDGLGALDGSVAPGTSFRGSFTFDPRTPNTVPPIDEGEAGLYHHDRPPAGVRIRVGRFLFRSVPGHPDFDVIVNDEIGFAGADEFGFSSRNNQARGILPAAPVDRLDLDWLASTITEDAIYSVELPRTPPDLALLGGGTLVIEGECTVCMAPAAFFRIEGTLTALTSPVRVSVDRDSLWWDWPAGAWGFDLVHGHLGPLLASGGDFATATEGCLANDVGDGTVSHAMTPASGEAIWFVVRDDDRTWDSYGVAQAGDRDLGIGASGHACP